MCQELLNISLGEPPPLSSPHLSSQQGRNIHTMRLKDEREASQQWYLPCWLTQSSIPQKATDHTFLLCQQKKADVSRRASILQTPKNIFEEYLWRAQICWVKEERGCSVSLQRALFCLSKEPQEQALQAEVQAWDQFGKKIRGNTQSVGMVNDQRYTSC